MNITKKDKFGRIHVSGIVSENPLTASYLYAIGTQSVFPVIAEVNLGNQKEILGNGTAFIYKQLIYENFSEIFLFTNLHVIQVINNAYNLYLTTNNAEINFFLKFKNQNIPIKEVFIPKGIYFQFVTKYGLFSYLDFAIIKIKIDSTEPLEFFSIKSNKDEVLKEGSKIYALGYPEHLNLSISDGIISHIYSDNEEILTGEIDHKNTIQHNILINPGNSGGPTINEYGNIIGISTYH